MTNVLKNRGKDEKIMQSFFLMIIKIELSYHNVNQKIAKIMLRRDFLLP